MNVWSAGRRPKALPELPFFDLGGIVFSLYPHDDMAKDINVEPKISRDAAYQGFALAHNVASEDEVDAVFSHLKDKGAKISKEPEHVFWGGYSGYFSDLDGHSWEVAYNPHWAIADDGRVSMTKG